MKIKNVVIVAALVMIPAAIISSFLVTGSGGNVQPPARTNHPNSYGYYELGNMMLNFSTGNIDTEIWLEHPGLGLPGYSWAARYQIPLQGNITLTDAIYNMFQDATWRTHMDIRESRHPKWMPVSSMEWLFSPQVKSITDTIMVGDPIFVSVF